LSEANKKCVTKVPRVKKVKARREGRKQKGMGGENWVKAEEGPQGRRVKRGKKKENKTRCGAVRSECISSLSGTEGGGSCSTSKTNPRLRGKKK